MIPVLTSTSVASAHLSGRGRRVLDDLQARRPLPPRDAARRSPGRLPEATLQVRALPFPPKRLFGGDSEQAVQEWLLALQN